MAAIGPTGIPLVNRSLNLVIGFPADPGLDVKVPFNQGNALGLDVSGFDVDFTVTKSLRPTEPNSCVVKIYNLNDSSRQNISGAHALTLKLDAGYKGQTSQLYFGDVHAGWTTRHGADYVTTLESSDTIASPTGVHGTRKPQSGAMGVVTKTFGPYVPIDQAFAAIADQLGIGVGNLKAALATAPNKPAVNSAAIYGNAGRRMTDLCRSAGLEWSIQDGQLQLTNIGKALSSTQAIVISTETGMVESPSVDSQGCVQVKTLLIPGLTAGGLVVIDSVFVQKGGYRIEKIRLQGSTYAQPWYAEMDCVRY